MCVVALFRTQNIETHGVPPDELCKICPFALTKVRQCFCLVFSLPGCLEVLSTCLPVPPPPLSSTHPPPASPALYTCPPLPTAVCCFYFLCAAFPQFAHHSVEIPPTAGSCPRPARRPVVVGRLVSPRVGWLYCFRSHCNSNMLIHPARGRYPTRNMSENGAPVVCAEGCESLIRVVTLLP